MEDTVKSPGYVIPLIVYLLYKVGMICVLVNIDFYISLFLFCFCTFGVRFMVFNATFNNISAISWRSVLLVQETGVPGENYRQTLSHKVVFERTTLVMIGTSRLDVVHPFVVF